VSAAVARCLVRRVARRGAAIYFLPCTQPHHTLIHTLAVAALAAACALAQPPGVSQPESLRQAQQLIRQNRLDEALALYLQDLKNSPDSYAANSAAGQVLDLMGKGPEARAYLAKAIETAPDSRTRAPAQRTMAMSYGFDGDCRKAVEYEQQVVDYWAAQRDFYQQGEMADEAARVCLDSGDLDTAQQWYKKGHDVGLRQPDITPDRKNLWEFRWAHAQARLAARRGDRKQAQWHVGAAGDLLDKDPQMAAVQTQFFPYLTGYVASYLGEYKKAVKDLLRANPGDAFIQCLLGQAYEKLGEKDKATEYYRKAASAAAHNPPAAYARPFARERLG
jgi:tetratricopeptide (TPR) repeat protein